MTVATTSPLCRACSTHQKIHATRGVFASHLDPEGLRCPGSGKTRGEVDDLLRTFNCWENTKEVTRRTVLHDEGDSVSLINTLWVLGASVEVAVRLEAQDVLRLIDELGVIARERGWHRVITTQER